MTAEQIAAFGPAFTAFTHSFSGCFPRSETRRHLATYGRGLLSDLPRKSVEPNALVIDRAAPPPVTPDHVSRRRTSKPAWHGRSRRAGIGMEQGSSGRDTGTQTPAGNEDVLDLVRAQCV